MEAVTSGGGNFDNPVEVTAAVVGGSAVSLHSTLVRASVMLNKIVDLLSPISIKLTYHDITIRDKPISIAAVHPSNISVFIIATSVVEFKHVMVGPPVNIFGL